MKRLFTLTLCVFFIACTHDGMENFSPTEKTDECPYALSPDDAASLLKDFLNDHPATKSGNMTIASSNVLQYDIPDIRTDAVSLAVGKIPVYQFTTINGGKQGYSLVVGDERIQKVLAFVEDGSLADTASIEPLKWFIESIPDIILNNLITYYDPIVEKKEFVSTKADYIQTFGPLLKTTWGQIAPYNAQCPVYCSKHSSATCDLVRMGGRCPAGCVAITISQILAYYRKPTHLNWNSILANPKIDNAPAAAKNALAAFIREVGGRLQTNYGCTSSGVDADITFDNMKHTLNSYNVNPGVEYKGFSFDQIMANLQFNRPVIINARKDGSGDGHVWICDGWKRHDYYGGDSYYYLNMNWGWGKSNGFYYLENPVSFITWGTFDDLHKYNSDFKMLINIRG